MKLTKKQLLELDQILDAIEVKAGDPKVANLAKTHLRCVAYSWSKNGYCSSRLYRDRSNKFFVAKTHDDVCYVAYVAELNCL